MCGLVEGLLLHSVADIRNCRARKEELLTCRADRLLLSHNPSLTILELVYLFVYFLFWVMEN